ncbi:hypothetical protein AAFF_G00294420 [Aldrovandia affinis]|uniref:Uncharacterized protein n=1 Tax=Aldrovandia affinis TaxID=143900 RepID=A0AAD7R9I6_9TELE|nr:hypothetical protein AAFF_G00294420 [Aldrovandia affinis]
MPARSRASKAERLTHVTSVRPHGAAGRPSACFASPSQNRTINGENVEGTDRAREAFRFIIRAASASRQTGA